MFKAERCLIQYHKHLLERLSILNVFLYMSMVLLLLRLRKNPLKQWIRNVLNVLTAHGIVLAGFFNWR